MRNKAPDVAEFVRIRIVQAVTKASDGSQLPFGYSGTLANPPLLARFYLFCDSGVNPLAGPVGPVFTFPNGDNFLDRIDQPLAGGEGFASMCAADGHRDAGFAHFQMSQAVHDGAMDKGPTLQSLLFQFSQFPFGHFPIAFVIQRQGLSSLGCSAGGTQKQQHGACFRGSDPLQQLFGLNLLIGKSRHGVGGLIRH